MSKDCDRCGLYTHVLMKVWNNQEDAGEEEQWWCVDCWWEAR